MAAIIILSVTLLIAVIIICVLWFMLKSKGSVKLSAGKSFHLDKANRYARMSADVYVETFRDGRDDN